MAQYGVDTGYLPLFHHVSTNFQLVTRIIDTGHWYFSLSMSDVNMDGKVDIVTTWNSNTNGSFVVYEIPDDFRLESLNILVLHKLLFLFGCLQAHAGYNFSPT